MQQRVSLKLRTMSEVYRYAFDKRFAPFWLPLARAPEQGRCNPHRRRPIRRDVRPARDWRPPLDNVDGAHITRGYRWWTAAGARMSFADDGLTFGTNADAGVCVHFRDKVPTVVPSLGSFGAHSHRCGSRGSDSHALGGT